MYTKNFTKVLLASIVAMFFFLGFDILEAFIRANGNVSYLDSYEDNGRIFNFNTGVSVVRNILISVFFWGAIGYLTNERKGALMAFGAVLFSILFSIISQVIFQEFGIAWLNTALYVLGFAVSALPYIIFGYFSLKSEKLWMYLILYFAFSGFSVLLPITNEYYEVFNGILNFFGFENIFNLRVNTAEDSYTTINLIKEFIKQFYIPTEIIIFWFFHHQVTSSKPFDWTLRRVETTPQISQLTFSIIFWVARTILFISTMGIISIITQLGLFEGAKSYFILNISCGFLFVFILGSIYRNMLTSYLVQRGRFPSWQFLLLNIPFICFFAWCYTLVKEPEVIPKTILSEEPDRNKANLKYTKRQYGIEDGNIGIKITIMAFLAISYFSGYFKIGRELTADSINIIIYGISGLISIGLTAWYFHDKKAFLILFISQWLVVIFFLLFNVEVLGFFLLAVGLPNLVIYYSLFHFNHLDFLFSNQPDEEEVQQVE